MALILKILSILGIIVLVILGIMILLLLLVLFMPIFYRIKAYKDSEDFSINIKASWLLGLVRVKGIFPKPGNITAKVLFFKVFDTAKAENDGKKASDKSDKKTTKNANKAEDDKEAATTAANDKVNPDEAEEAAGEASSNDNASSDSILKSEPDKNDGKKSLKDKITDKCRNILYTIRNLYDKIKGVSEDVEFYKNLLSEDNTVELMKHAVKRLKLILRNIRPRRLRARVVYGAATPDVTGYVYGIYGMFASALGRKVYFTPDFCNEIFEGDVYAAGHITVFTVLFNAAMVMFDRKLKLLRRKLKRHSLGKDKKEHSKTEQTQEIQNKQKQNKEKQNNK
jgi:hypothetical protein